MSEEEPVPDCDECGRSVPLFAAACPGCAGGCDAASEAPCADCGTAVDPRRRESCPECGATLDPWAIVVDRVRQQGFHVDVPASDDLPCPTTAGFVRGRGKPVGQRADYRRPLDDGSEIHVREFGDRYAVHRDRRSAQNRIGHLTRDAPLETAAGVASLYLLTRAARRVGAPSRAGLGAAITSRERLGAAVPSGGRLRSTAPTRLADAVPTPSLSGRLRLPRPSLRSLFR